MKLSPRTTIWRYLSDRRWAVLSICGGLLCWEILSRFVIGSQLFLAAPSQVAVALFDLSTSGVLAHHLWVSGLEFLIGYVLAAVLGIGIGIAMAVSKPTKMALQPWVSGLYATPTVALAPLFILWLGVGVPSKVVMVATLVVFPVILNTEVGLQLTSRQLVETVRSFGANRWQIFRMVELPSALPLVFVGLRLGIGRGLIGVVVAELFGARAGLGQLISQAADNFNMPDLFAGVAILAIAGIALTAGFEKLEARLLPWRE